jgi:hypothetical protein
LNEADVPFLANEATRPYRIAHIELRTASEIIDSSEGLIVYVRANPFTADELARFSRRVRSARNDLLASRSRRVEEGRAKTDPDSQHE